MYGRIILCAPPLDLGRTGECILDVCERGGAIVKSQEKTILNKRRLFIIGIIILAILLVPIPRHFNGGPSEYRAVIYTIYSYNTFDGDRYWGGIRIDIFNRTVFDNVRVVREMP